MGRVNEAPWGILAEPDRWELSATKTGTKVKVTHSGLADQPVARKDYAGGWPGLLELLRKFCE